MHLEYQKDVDYLPSTNITQYIIIGKIQIVYHCTSKLPSNIFKDAKKIPFSCIYQFAKAFKKQINASMINDQKHYQRALSNFCFYKMASN